MSLLSQHQIDAISKMTNGCILWGGVGSGKSRAGLAYFYIHNGGNLATMKPMTRKQDLYIITTAKKRDDMDWNKEAIPFGLYDKVIVDSWNNIKKYVNIKDAFFIFDEQRVVGNGVWVKSFLKITKTNEWIMLSATPGDKWEDYIPVFIANGFYKNRTQFELQHCVYDYRAGYPRLVRYLETGRLIRLRNKILVEMPVERHTTQHHEDIVCTYDKDLYREVTKNRWNIFKDKPIETASELCLCWRQIVNEDESRQVALLEILEDHPKAIIFYNYDYELDILRNLMSCNDICYSEWNGHKHQDILTGDKWTYLVQYNAGAEGWNCIYTDTTIFYSQNYSYKIMEQAAGRIDRLNTAFNDLYYYHLKSRAPIDVAIHQAYLQKKDFNEGRYVNRSVERRAA